MASGVRSGSRRAPADPGRPLAKAIARSFGRDVVVWEEIWDHFGTNLDKSTIIHQASGPTALLCAVSVVGADEPPARARSG